MTGDRGFSFSGQLVTEPSLWLCQLCGILCYLALGQWTILILLRENLKHTYLSRHIFLRFNFLIVVFHIDTIFILYSVCKVH